MLCHDTKFDICEGWTLGISKWISMCDLIWETCVLVVAATKSICYMKNVLEMHGVHTRNGQFMFLDSNYGHIYRACVMVWYGMIQ